MFLKKVLNRKFSLNLSKFLQMKINSFLFRILPFSWSRAYLTVLGTLYYLLHPKEKALIQQTICHVLQKRFAPSQLKQKMKETFQGVFAHYHEKLFVGYSHFPKLLKFLKTQIRFAGAEQLQEALSAGKGVILVTGHFGAVEFLPGALAVNGYPTAMICRFQTNRLRESLGQRAEAVGLKLIDADRGNIILAAMQALKQGHILITECDEFDEWRLDPHQNTSFLHRCLPSDRTLEVLQKRSGAPVVSALVQREGKKRYACNLTAMKMRPEGTAMPLHEQCLAVLENAVENHPEQWYQWKKFGELLNLPPVIEDGLKEPRTRQFDLQLAPAGQV